MKQTIAQQIKWDFKTNDLLVIKDKDGRLIYLENSIGEWSKWEYGSKGKCIYFENSRGFWEKRELGPWGNTIYFEDSEGYFEDNRPNQFEGKEILIGGEKFKLVKV